MIYSFLLLIEKDPQIILRINLEESDIIGNLNDVSLVEILVISLKYQKNHELKKYMNYSAQAVAALVKSANIA